MLKVGMLCELIPDEESIPTWKIPPTMLNIPSNVHVSNMQAGDICLLVGDVEHETVRILMKNGPCYIVSWALRALKVV